MEKCKESKKAAADSKKATPAPNVAVNSAARAGAASKFLSGAASAETKAGAAAAGAVSGGGARVIGEFEVSAPESHAARGPGSSAAVGGQESERHSPRVAADPIILAPVASVTGSSGRNFSDLAEM